MSCAGFRENETKRENSRDSLVNSSRSDVSHEPNINRRITHRSTPKPRWRYKIPFRRTHASKKYIRVPEKSKQRTLTRYMSFPRRKHTRDQAHSKEIHIYDEVKRRSSDENEFGFYESMVSDVFDTFTFDFEICDESEAKVCISSEEKKSAHENGNSLLYGEIMPRGISKLLDGDHLNCNNARVLCDLGMGFGKLILQAFIEFPHLTEVIGIELSSSRFQIACKNARSFSEWRPSVRVTVDEEHVFELAEQIDMDDGSVCDRVLKLYEGDIFDFPSTAAKADIVIMAISVPHQRSFPKVCHFLSRLSVSARIATYLDIASIHATSAIRFPFRQLEINHPSSDRFATSWAKNGFHFLLWERTATSVLVAPFVRKSKSKNSNRRRNESHVQLSSGQIDSKGHPPKPLTPPPNAKLSSSPKRKVVDRKILCKECNQIVLTTCDKAIDVPDVRRSTTRISHSRRTSTCAACGLERTPPQVSRRAQSLDDGTRVRGGRQSEDSSGGRRKWLARLRIPFFRRRR
eukprot:228120_1